MHLGLVSMPSFFYFSFHFQVEDENYRSAKTAHQKWTRHQAFEAEVAANRAKMDELRAEGEALMREKPQFSPEIRR